jgi:hypothetical protein
LTDWPKSGQTVLVPVNVVETNVEMFVNVAEVVWIAENPPDAGTCGEPPPSELEENPTIVAFPDVAAAGNVPVVCVSVLPPASVSMLSAN